LLTFSGSIYNNTTLLKWTTTSELSSSRCDIEKSTDGKTFKKISSVAGAGSSTIKRSYSYTDETTITGTVYYRLKEIDFNGNIHYSNTINVSISKPKVFELKVFPNPTTDYLLVQANDIVKNDVHLILTNMKGQTMVSRTIAQGSTLSIIETATLYAGEYIVTAFDASGYKQSYKVIISK